MRLSTRLRGRYSTSPIAFLFLRGVGYTVVDFGGTDPDAVVQIATFTSSIDVSVYYVALGRATSFKYTYDMIGRHREGGGTGIGHPTDLENPEGVLAVSVPRTALVRRRSTATRWHPRGRHICTGWRPKAAIF